MTTWYKGRPIAEYLKGVEAKCAVKGHAPERITDCDDVNGKCICAEVVAGTAYQCARCKVRVPAPARRAPSKEDLP